MPRKFTVERSGSCRLASPPAAAGGSCASASGDRTNNATSARKRYFKEVRLFINVGLLTRLFTSRRSGSSREVQDSFTAKGRFGAYAARLRPATSPAVPPGCALPRQTGALRLAALGLMWNRPPSAG